MAGFHGSVSCLSETDGNIGCKMVAISFAGVVSLTLLLLVARGGRKLLNTSDKIRRMQKSKTIK